MGKITEKKETTKIKIIDTFWELYEQKRIEKITVSEITTRAKINRSTFYAYFDDVYDVLDTIEQRYIPDPLHHHEPFQPPEDPQKFFDQVIEHFEKNRKYVGLLLSDQGDPNFVIKLKEALRPILKEHMCRELEDSPKVELLIEHVLCSTIGVIIYWFQQPDPISSKELFLFLHDLVRQGTPYNIEQLKKSQALKH